jgi:hypothetical protein
MTRLRLIPLSLLTGTALLMAQDPQNGGWRRFGEPLPAPAPQTSQASQAPQGQAGQPDVILDQDPTQPVARVDGYGQPEQPQQPEQQPQLRTRPPAQVPAAVPHYGLPNAVQIKPGTYVTVRTAQGLSSDHNQAGDFFSASLAAPIVVDGIVVAQAGQHVIGKVAEAKKAGRVEGTSRLGLQLTGLTLVDGTQANIQSYVVQRNGQTSVGSDVAAVGATTATGAAIGAAADWGRGAAIGAGAGAAAGLVGVLLTRGRPTVVYPESLLTFRLDSPVIIDLTHAPQAFRYVGPGDFDQPVQSTMARRPPAQGGPGYGPSYGPGFGPGPYVYPSYVAPGWGWGYPYGWGPGFGVGVVIRGGGWGWGGRRWR